MSQTKIQSIKRVRHSTKILMIEVSLFGNKIEVKMKYNYFDSMFADGLAGIFNGNIPDLCCNDDVRSF